MIVQTFTELVGQIITAYKTRLFSPLEDLGNKTKWSLHNVLALQYTDENEKGAS